MTRSLRTFAGVFLAALFLATGLALGQSQPGSAKVTPRPAQPAANGVRPAAAGAAAPRQPAAGNVAPQPTPPPKVDPQLEKLLREWEVSSAKIKSLHGKHIRSRCNSVFATDARATGQFYFEAPDKGRIDLKGQTPEKGAVSSKQTKDGEAYTLTADRDEKWICDGKQVMMINDAEKEYEAIPLPEEMRGKNIIESPLPFLFGMKAADAKKRFQMELIHLDEKRNLARLTVLPLQAKDAQNFVRAEIVLDTKEYLPKFVSLVDPVGTLTTQYIFQEVTVNDPGALAKLRGLVGLNNNPFKPDLKNYKLVQQPVQPAGGAVPGGKITPVGGKAPAPGNGTPVLIPGGVRPTAPRATQSGTSQPLRTKQ